MLPQVRLIFVKVLICTISVQGLFPLESLNAQSQIQSLSQFQAESDVESLQVAQISSPEMDILTEQGHFHRGPLDITAVEATTEGDIEKLRDILKGNFQKSGGSRIDLVGVPENEIHSSSTIEALSLAAELDPRVSKNRLVALPSESDRAPAKISRSRIVVTLSRMSIVGGYSFWALHFGHNHFWPSLFVATVTAALSSTFSFGINRYSEWLSNNTYLRSWFSTKTGGQLNRAMNRTEPFLKVLMVEGTYYGILALASHIVGILPAETIGERWHAFWVTTLFGTLTQGPSDAGIAENRRLDLKELKLLPESMKWEAESRSERTALLLQTLTHGLEGAAGPMLLSGASTTLGLLGFAALGIVGLSIYGREVYRNYQRGKHIAMRRQMGWEYRKKNLDVQNDPWVNNQIYHLNWKPPSNCQEFFQ